MKKKAPRVRPRLAWAIVMHGGKIDEISLRRKALYPMTDQGEQAVKVLVSPAPAKKPRKKPVK